MSIGKLDHYSIRTTDLPRAIRFYGQALGFTAGPRPPFSFPGAWLYPLAENGEPRGSALVHLIGIDPQAGDGLRDYLGDGAAPNAMNTGALDHIAMTAEDITALHDRLAEHAIPYRERKVPDMDLHQVFLKDPDGLTIELNFHHAEDIAAGRRNMAAQAAR